MIRTTVPVSVWEQEGDAVIYTAFRLLSEADADDEPTGYIDADDPSTIPPEWRS